MTSSGASRTHAYALLTVTPLFFASNMVIGRVAVEVAEPWSLAFWRWTIATAILLPFAWPGLRTHAGALLAQWKLLCLLGFLGMWICGGLVYFSLRHTTATNGILIYTTSPVFILILEIVFRGERASVRRLAGIAMAFAGVAVTVLEGDLARLARLEFNPGDVGIAVAAMSWAVYSVLLRRPGLSALPTIPLFAAISLAGCIVVAPFMLFETTIMRTVPDTGAAWANILMLAIMPSILAFSTYQYGIKLVGATVASIFSYLMPLYGVALSVVFLGEELEGYHAVGLILVTTGVVVATFPSALLGRRLRSLID